MTPSRRNYPDRHAQDLVLHHSSDREQEGSRIAAHGSPQPGRDMMGKMKQILAESRRGTGPG